MCPDDALDSCSPRNQKGSYFPRGTLPVTGGGIRRNRVMLWRQSLKERKRVTSHDQKKPGRILSAGKNSRSPRKAGGLNGPYTTGRGRVTTEGEVPFMTTGCWIPPVQILSSHRMNWQFKDYNACLIGKGSGVEHGRMTSDRGRIELGAG